MIKESVYPIAAIIFTFLLNYVFHLVVARNLGPAGYGLFGAYLTIWIFLNNAFIAFQNATVIEVKQIRLLSPDDENAFISCVFFNILLISFALSGIFYMLWPYAQKIIHHHDIISRIFYSLFIGFWIFIPVFIGTFQASGYFQAMASCIAIPYVFRLIFSLLAIFFFSAGVTGIISVMSLELLVSIVLFFGILMITGIQFEKFDIRIQRNVFNMIGYAFYLILITTPLSILMNIDVIFARYLFRSFEAGYYTTAATLGKIPVYIIVTLVSVMLPRLIQLKMKNDNWFRFLFVSLLLNTGLLLVGWLCIYGLAPIVIPLLYGENFKPAVDILQRYGLLALCHGIFQTLIQACMVLKLIGPQVLSAVTILIMIPFGMMHVKTSSNLIQMFIVINAVVILETFIWVGLTQLKKRNINDNQQGACYQ